MFPRTSNTTTAEHGNIVNGGTGGRPTRTCPTTTLSSLHLSRYSSSVRCDAAAGRNPSRSSKPKPQPKPKPPKEEWRPSSLLSGCSPLELDPPPECAAAWLRGHHAWVELAMEPIPVQGRTTSGKFALCSFGSASCLPASWVKLYYRYSELCLTCQLMDKQAWIPSIKLPLSAQRCTSASAAV